MTAAPPGPKEIQAAIAAFPGAKSLLDALCAALPGDVAVYGGAIRDLLTVGYVRNDIDILVTGTYVGPFADVVRNAVASLGVTVTDHPPTHVIVSWPSVNSHFDVHYPRESLLAGLVRSDFTANGIAFSWRNRSIEDPLEGVRHLTEKRLVLHSPQYIVTDAPTFARMFRTAASLKLPIDEPTEAILRRFAPLVSLHNGKTNVRTLFEFLKFFSLVEITPYLRQMNRTGLVEGLFPELAIAATVLLGPRQSILDRNVELAGTFDTIRSTPEVHEFLDCAIGNGITNRGIMRLMTLFLDLGRAYAEMKPNAPYVEAEAGKNLKLFGTRIEARLLRHIAARYREASTLAEIFSHLPLIFESIDEGALIENVPDSFRPHAIVLRSLVEAARSKAR